MALPAPRPTPPTRWLQARLQDRPPADRAVSKLQYFRTTVYTSAAQPHSKAAQPNSATSATRSSATSRRVGLTLANVVVGKTPPVEWPLPVDESPRHPRCDAKCGDDPSLLMQREQDHFQASGPRLVESSPGQLDDAPIRVSDEQGSPCGALESPSGSNGLLRESETTGTKRPRSPDRLTRIKEHEQPALRGASPHGPWACMNTILDKACLTKRCRHGGKARSGRLPVLAESQRSGWVGLVTGRLR